MAVIWNRCPERNREGRSINRGSESPVMAPRNEMPTPPISVHIALRIESRLTAGLELNRR